VPPAILLRFLREHRSEWADNGIDAYAASAIKAGPCSLPVSRAGNFGGQVILPLAHTIENEEASTPLFDHLGFNIFSFLVPSSVINPCTLLFSNAMA
jgi:homeobox-leucine zipper protein